MTEFIDNVKLKLMTEHCKKVSMFNDISLLIVTFNDFCHDGISIQYKLEEFTEQQLTIQFSGVQSETYGIYLFTELTAAITTLRSTLSKYGWGHIVIRQLDFDGHTMNASITANIKED